MIFPGFVDFASNAPGQDSTFRWAEVISVDPLVIQLDGDPRVLDATPSSLIEPSTLRVGARVWTQMCGRQVIAVGTSSPQKERAGFPPIALPASPYVGQTVSDSASGMTRLWTGTRWRWVGGVQQSARWTMQNKSLASGANVVTPGTKASSGVWGNDPLDIFYVSGNEMRTRVAGTFFISGRLNFSVNSPSVVTWISPGESFGGGLPNGSGATMSVVYRFAADTGFTSNVHLYSGTVSTSGGAFQMVCLSEEP